MNASEWIAAFLIGAGSATLLLWWWAGWEVRKFEAELEERWSRRSAEFFSQEMASHLAHNRRTHRPAADSYPAETSRSACEIH